MSEVLEPRVSPGLVKALTNKVKNLQGRADVQMSVPVDQDNRPCLSGGELPGSSKLDLSVTLQSVSNKFGASCLLFAVAPRTNTMLRLPIGLSGLSRPPVEAMTTDGKSNGAYDRFEGAVESTDGRLLAKAILPDGSADYIDVAQGPVGRDFVQTVLGVSIIKLNQN